MDILPTDETEDSSLKNADFKCVPSGEGALSKTYSTQENSKAICVKSTLRLAARNRTESIAAEIQLGLRE
jgi:hypothetical protein